MSGLEHKTIVAVDDTAAIRTFLRISLQDLGVNFHEASTASEGLQLCQEQDPDLVVLDLGLPDRDGLDILPEIKALRKGRAPAVIVLTVRNDRKTRDIAREKGAEAFMTKPFEMDDLIETIQTILN